MKFNKDCVRDILLQCEELFVMEDNGEMNDVDSTMLKEKMSSYTLAEIKYAVKKMEEADLIDCRIVGYDGCDISDFYIWDITVEGHEFIENIRNDSNWDKVKNISKHVGSSSLEILKDISKQILTQAIITNIGL